MITLPLDNTERFITYGEGREGGVIVKTINGKNIVWPRPNWYSKDHCPGCWFYVLWVTNRSIIVDGRHIYSLKEEDKILFDYCKMFDPCKKDWHWERKSKYSKFFHKIDNYRSELSAQISSCNQLDSML